jgi:hypothetical protein
MAILAGFPVVALFALILVGTVAGLHTVYILGLLILVVVALSVVIWKKKDTEPTELVRAPAASSSAEELCAQNIALALFAAFGGILTIRTFWNGTSFFSDDYAYHATAVAHWMVQHDLSTPSYNFAGYYPLNAELFSLWFCLPLHQDAWASLSGLYWILFTAAAAIALSLAQNLTPFAGLMVGAMIASSPNLVWQARTFSATDLAAAGLILAAILFSAAPALEKSRTATGSACVIYGGLLAGLAVGTKVTAAPLSDRRCLLVHERLDNDRQPAISSGVRTVSRPSNKLHAA